MKKISFCCNPLLKIQPELLKLEKDMVEVLKKDNKVEALVELFKVIAPLHDQNPFAPTLLKLQKKGKKYAKEIAVLENLQKFFVGWGRDLYGVNRTVVGQQVTAENIWIGSFNGLNTFQASYWLYNQERLKRDYHPDFKSTWDCVHRHCQNLVDDNAIYIISQIAALKKS